MLPRSHTEDSFPDTFQKKCFSPHPEYISPAENTKEYRQNISGSENRQISAITLFGYEIQG
jgi:hypothetical protein